MDLTPFLPTIGVIVGALATLGGVTINARSSRKADEKRLDVEDKRETARIEREEAAQRKSAEEARSTKRIQIYEGLAQHFMNELSGLRALQSSQPTISNGEFDEWFGREWPPHADMRLRRALASVTNDEHRVGITKLCDSILDNAEMADLHWRKHMAQVEALVTLGSDLNSAYARNQALDPDLQKRWRVFEKERQYTLDKEAEALKARVDAVVKRVGKTRIPKTAPAADAPTSSARSGEQTSNDA